MMAARSSAAVIYAEAHHVQAANVMSGASASAWTWLDRALRVFVVREGDVLQVGVIKSAKVLLCETSHPRSVSPDF